LQHRETRCIPNGTLMRFLLVSGCLLWIGAAGAQDQSNGREVLPAAGLSERELTAVPAHLRIVRPAGAAKREVKRQYVAVASGANILAFGLPN
jgi:hypothetical protein